MEPTDQLEPAGEYVRVTTVAGAVLPSFFGKLASVEDLDGCAEQLRRLVLVDGVFAEAAVRKGLAPLG